ncbi:unnamed protein product [Auanema sp. JU1783]|nr:unnamed protein product [Auanema sp. JU1783]
MCLIGNKYIQLKQEQLIRIVVVCLIIAYFFYFFIIYEEERTHADLIQETNQSISAKLLPKKGKLFCWVQTSKKYHSTRVKAINSTWLKRCDNGQFFTSDSMDDESIPYTTVFHNMPDSWYKLFRKSRYAFYHIYQEISKDFEWYLKADDDSYVIVEHLKEFLSQFDHNKPYLIGHTYKPYLEHGYVSGGATYAISREALRIFAEELYFNITACPLNGPYEDLEMSRCFSHKNIFPIDTRNAKGQQRFHPEPMNTIMERNEENKEFAMNKVFKGMEAFAEETISFHHLSPTEIRVLDSILYRIQSPQLSSYYKINKENQT